MLAMLGVVAKIAFGLRWMIFTGYIVLILTFGTWIRDIDLLMPIIVVGLPSVVSAILGIGVWNVTKHRRILLYAYTVLSLLIIAGGAAWTSMWMVDHDQAFPVTGSVRY
jgi:hypothetical protein